MEKNSDFFFFFLRFILLVSCQVSTYLKALGILCDREPVQTLKGQTDRIEMNQPSTSCAAHVPGSEWVSTLPHLSVLAIVLHTDTADHRASGEKQKCVDFLKISVYFQWIDLVLVFTFVRCFSVKSQELIGVIFYILVPSEHILR